MTDTPKDLAALLELRARVLEDAMMTKMHPAMWAKFARAVYEAELAAGVVPMPVRSANYIKIDGEPVHELRGPVDQVYSVFIAASPYQEDKP